MIANKLLYVMTLAMTVAPGSRLTAQVQTDVPLSLPERSLWWSST